MAVSADGQRVAMVQQAIQNGGRLVAQHGALVADGSVKRDNDASSFVAATDELELQTRGAAGGLSGTSAIRSRPREISRTPS